MAKRKDEDIVEQMKKGLSSFFKDDRSEEAKLLQRRDRKRRAFATHRRAYTVVMSGLALIFVLAAIAGLPASIALLLWGTPALFWGMGFAMHGLTYRAWTKENLPAIAAAERKLGRLPAGKTTKQLAAGKDVPVIEGVPILDDEWRSILSKAKAAVARALEALKEAQHQQAGAFELERQLSDGMANIERLAAGAERIIEAVDEIAPDGGEHLDTELELLDEKIGDTEDDQLKEVYLANRSMLVARRAKLTALEGERARMKANAEGFLIAAENIRLDIASLGSGDGRKPTALVEPVRRLNEEVEILRKVEAELKQFG